MAKANQAPTKIPMMKSRYPIQESDDDDDILTPKKAVGGTSRILSEQQSSIVIEAPPMVAPVVISEQVLEDLAAEQEGASNLLMDKSTQTKDKENKRVNWLPFILTAIAALLILIAMCKYWYAPAPVTTLQSHAIFLKLY